jgi:acetyl esterase/lipase
MTEEPAGSEVTRFIPVPTSISEEAQAFLGMADLFGEAGGSEPHHTDIEAWRAHIATANEGLIGVLGMQPTVPTSAIEETSVDGVPVYVLTPEGTPDHPDQPIYFDIHGGALVMGGGDACQVMATKTAAMVRMKTWSVDYRMPPDHRYPVALDDCLTAYRALLEVQPAERIAVGGGSAGGNLAAAMMLRARDEGLPLPAALVLLTPEADLTESGDSFATNLGIDPVLRSKLTESIALYADGHDLTDPYVSPLFGDFTPPFPPTFVQAGTRDLFLSNAVRLHRKLRAAGIEADLHVFEAMPHGGFFGAPEDRELAAEVRRFLAAHVPA